MTILDDMSAEIKNKIYSLALATGRPISLTQVKIGIGPNAALRTIIPVHPLTLLSKEVHAITRLMFFTSNIFSIKYEFVNVYGQPEEGFQIRDRLAMLTRTGRLAPHAITEQQSPTDAHSTSIKTLRDMQLLVYMPEDKRYPGLEDIVAFSEHLLAQSCAEKEFRVLSG